MDKNNNIDRFLADAYTKDSFGGHSGLLGVREDPTRYITRTDKVGIYNMFTEIFDNALDETIQTARNLKRSGRENLEPLYVGVYINNDDGTVAISDQGRGAPLEPSQNHPEVPTAVAIFQEDNMGSKGTKAGKTVEQEGDTIGVHGAGAFVVTALSEYLHVENKRYNPETNKIERYQFSFKEGEMIVDESWYMGRMEYLGESTTPIGNGRTDAGMTVTYKPDPTIMRTFNQETGEDDKHYYDIYEIRTRIKDMLKTLMEEMRIIVQLKVEGFNATEEILDSAELSLTKDLTEGKDFIQFNINPNDYPELEKMINERGISEFNASMLVIKNDGGERDDPNKYIGYVNRIRVNSSPHITETKRMVNSNIGRLCNADRDLEGYTNSDQYRGLTFITLLTVATPQWGGQVKTDFTDNQVSHIYGLALGNMGAFRRNGVAYEMLQHSLEMSKPHLLIEKDAQDKREQLRRQQEMQEREQIQKQRASAVAPESIRYLQSQQKLEMLYEVRDSILVIIEGKSAGDSVLALARQMPELAIYTGMMGKINNVNNFEVPQMRMSLEAMHQTRQNITVLHELQALMNAGFRSILVMADNDADGSHIKSLLRFFIWREHRNIIEEGRLIEISPNFCTYNVSSMYRDEDGEDTSDLKYDFMGNAKELNPAGGSLETEAEYQVVRTKFKGRVTFKLFKGVASVPESLLIQLLRNPDNWKPVPALNTKEEYEINQFFTDSSEFKRAFTRNEYSSEMVVRKEMVRGTIFGDTRPSIQQIKEGTTLSDKPIFSSTSRRTLEDYEEMGSAEIETRIMEAQLEGFTIY